MIRVGIVGATGYTGETLVDILLKHPEVRITYLSAKIDKADRIDKIFPHLSGKINLVCDNFDFDKAVASCDLLFLAVPHTLIGKEHYEPERSKSLRDRSTAV